VKLTVPILFVCSSLLLSPALAHATSITVGTPGNSQLSTPTGPSPKRGPTLINFDSLTPGSSGPSFTIGGVTISSPDGLEVLPFSTQSDPNELFDTSADGSANILIRLAQGALAIGVGIADSDPVSVMFQALDSTGTPFGSIFTEDLASTESAINFGNGYYVISDTTPDIFGLRIIQSTGDNTGAFSGLAIDDVQVATVPEPGTAVLCVAGLGMFGILRRRLF
jgi:hypothetical protein